MSDIMNGSEFGVSFPAKISKRRSSMKATRRSILGPQGDGIIYGVEPVLKRASSLQIVSEIISIGFSESNT
jgi:hypothetical protein